MTCSNQEMNIRKSEGQVIIEMPTDGSKESSAQQLLQELGDIDGAYVDIESQFPALRSIRRRLREILDHSP